MIFEAKAAMSEANCMRGCIDGFRKVVRFAKEDVAYGDTSAARLLSEDTFS